MTPTVPRRRHKQAYLTLGNRADRAGFGTGAALHALIGVDLVMLITLSDDAERASLCTGSAADAFIADNVCHDVHLHYFYTAMGSHIAMLL